ncbi:MAG: diacylglycerol kinase family lipid kinase [Gemmatimonadota bacterium]
MVQDGDADVRAAGELLTDGRRHFVILNPAAGRRRGRKRLAAYQRLLREELDDVTFASTGHAGEERELADRAVAEGYDVVVAVGGDGTWSAVADRIVASGREDVALGILPSGTGNDFGRNFGYDPRSPQVAVRILAQGHVRTIDIGRVDSPSTPDVGPEHMEPRHFLNVVGFGFDIAVIDAAARARFLKGELLYKVTALQQLFRFDGFGCHLEPGSGEPRDGTHLMLTVSNGRYFGGGFPIAPNATITDGLLHACRIGDASPLGRLQLFNKAEKGTHVTSEKVEIVSDATFRLTFEDPPRFEVDGDVFRAAERTVQLSVLPDRLRVVAPRG